MTAPGWLDELDLHAGPPEAAMGTRALDDDRWLLVDEDWVDRRDEARSLLDQRRDDVLAPGPAPAAAEVGARIDTWLASRHPALVDGGHLGEPDPLAAARRRVAEDLCLLEPGPDGWVLTAGAVCFPSYWRLADKVGHPLGDVHTPVPGYHGPFAARVDGFLGRLRPDQGVWRRNWSIHDSPTLHVPTHADGMPATERWLRTEYQTLLRLPETGAVVFTIRTQQVLLEAIADRPDVSAAMAAALRGWTPAQRAYKGSAVDDALVGWLKNARYLAWCAVTQAFDLNIERVLEHWPVSHAIRELLANALDEHHLTGTAEPEVRRLGDGRWEIRDHGRGLRYEHLTQKENPEKLGHAAVIGQFGIGLKDALAVFDRHGIGITIRSRHGDITTASRPKADFPDVVTLHGLVDAPTDPDLDGTSVVLDGVADDDMATARSFFLRWNDDAVLESTRYGSVLGRPSDDAPGRIYVKGLLVAEEPDFLFSYDITDLNASLRRALNRERSNVGRTAYSDRVKDILRSCTSSAVAAPLTGDLARFASGAMHDELGWKDVAVHACRVLQTTDDVVFVTPRQIGTAAVAYARDDGYRPIIVPDDIAKALRSVTDLDGRPMFDLRAFQEEWNDSFTFGFVEPDDLSADERAVLDLLEPLLVLADITPADHGVEEIKISETMRLGEGDAQVVGVWDAGIGQIVIRRDQLETPEAFCGTVLHELEHAISGAGDVTFAFEEALTGRLGTLANRSLNRIP